MQKAFKSSDWIWIDFGMERAMKKDGLTLLRVWGTNVGHKYTAEAKNELNQFVDEVVARGKTNYPSKVHLTTRTAAYNWNGGVRIRRLEREWERADVVLPVAPVVEKAGRR